MNIDRYTKCRTHRYRRLPGVDLRDGRRPPGVGAASAAARRHRDLQGTVQPVVIVGTGTMDRTGNVDREFQRERRGRSGPIRRSRSSFPTRRLKPLPVSLPYSTDTPIPVEISAVRKAGEWEPIRAKVEDAPVKPRPGGGVPPQ